MHNLDILNIGLIYQTNVIRVIAFAKFIDTKVYIYLYIYTYVTVYIFKLYVYMYKVKSYMLVSLRS